MARPIKIRASRRRGLDCPEPLTRQITDYVLGKSKTVPTVRLNIPKAAK